MFRFVAKQARGPEIGSPIRSALGQRKNMVFCDRRFGQAFSAHPATPTEKLDASTPLFRCVSSNDRCVSSAIDPSKVGIFMPLIVSSPHRQDLLSIYTTPSQDSRAVSIRIALAPFSCFFKASVAMLQSLRTFFFRIRSTPLFSAFCDCLPIFPVIYVGFLSQFFSVGFTESGCAFLCSGHGVPIVSLGCFGAEALYLPALIGAAGSVGSSAIAAKKKQPLSIPPAPDSSANALSALASAPNSMSTLSNSTMNPYARLFQ